MTISIIDLPGIDARGKGTVIYVPAIANLLSPKVSELTAAVAVNLSSILYTFNVTGEQSTVDRTKYCSTSIGQSLGAAKYKVDPMVYDYDPQNIEAADTYGYYAKLTPLSVGYLVDRRGLLRNVAPTAGQLIDIYPVQLGVQSRVAIDPTAEGEKLRISQAVAVISDPVFDIALVA